MSDLAAIGLAIVLLAGNAFFVGAEFALISARRSQIEPQALAGSRSAQRTLWAMENVSLMLAGAQLGITVCSLGLGAVGEPAIAHLIERPFAAVGLPEALLHPVAFVIALGIVIYLHMVLGEMVPKNLALAAPERSALILGPLLALLVRIAKPVIWLLNGSANTLLRMVGVDTRDEISSAFTADEVSAMLAESRREGLLDHEEHELLTGALQFEQIRADDLLIAPDDLVSVASSATAREVEDLVAHTGFSRFAVHDGGGNLTGYVHVKDVLDLEPDHEIADDRIRTLPVIPADATVEDIIETLQRTGSHLGQVQGPDSVLGVVALEDAIEELIGEVVDAAHTGATA